jgi:FixJ family two-component response regulator
VIDSDSSVQAALDRLLRLAGFRVRGFSSAKAFLKTPVNPDVIGCLILDVMMPEMTGLELQEELQRRGVDLPIIFLTAHGTVSITAQAMKAGATDFLEKPFDGNQVIGTISKATEDFRKKVSERAAIKNLVTRHRSLTRRQGQVFTAVVKGDPNKKIARDLGTTEKTVKHHRAKVMKKMQAASLAELVRMAGKLSLLP